MANRPMYTTGSLLVILKKEPREGIEKLIPQDSVELYKAYHDLNSAYEQGDAVTRCQHPDHRHKFKVDDAAAGNGNEGICTLVDKAPGTLAEGDMILEGFVGGGSVATRIKKIYNRTCRDFNNTRYTWAIQDDSTTNIMVVTPI